MFLQALGYVGIRAKSLDDWRAYGGAFDPYPSITMSIYDFRPTSRGALRLKSADPAAHLALQFNYLSTERDKRVAANAGEVSTMIFHPVGSAKIGLASDSRAVVDANLRVIGLDGLRVIDASVMPTVTSGNTNAPTMMIAEKGAAMNLAAAR